MWKRAGKPRMGQIFDRYRATKLIYKKRIRECQKQETLVYTNDLHEALLAKQSTAFWKCWRAKFEPGKKTVRQVSGLTDEQEIVEQFRQYFIEACSPLTDKGSVNLQNRYDLKRPTYCGTPWSDAMLLPARRRPQGIVIIGVCLSVCLCVRTVFVRKISQERVHGSPPNLVGGSRG